MYFLILQDFENLFPTQTRDFVYFSTSVFSLVIFLDYEFSLSHLVCAVLCCLCVIIFKDYVHVFFMYYTKNWVQNSFCFIINTA
jgi:hypothetical protein